jgi:hypothetical protein
MFTPIFLQAAEGGAFDMISDWIILMLPSGTLSAQSMPKPRLAHG